MEMNIVSTCSQEDVYLNFKRDPLFCHLPSWMVIIFMLDLMTATCILWSGHPDNRFNDGKQKRFVFYEPRRYVYFRNGGDLKIKDYLFSSGYKEINSDSITALLAGDPDPNMVIVFATDYFPKSIIQNGERSLLRKFLDAGGRIVLTGINPLVYEIDEKKNNRWVSMSRQQIRC